MRLDSVLAQYSTILPHVGVIVHHPVVEDDQNHSIHLKFLSLDEIFDDIDSVNRDQFKGIACGAQKVARACVWT